MSSPGPGRRRHRRPRDDGRGGATRLASARRRGATRSTSPGPARSRRRSARFDAGAGGQLRRLHPGRPLRERARSAPLAVNGLRRRHRGRGLPPPGTRSWSTSRPTMCSAGEAGGALPRRSSRPAPLSVYGVSKLGGERRALAAGGALVVRTSWVFGAGRRELRRHDRRAGPARRGAAARGRATRSALADLRPLSGASPGGSGRIRGDAGSFTTGTGSPSPGTSSRARSCACSAIPWRYEPVTSAEMAAAAQRPAWSVLAVEKFESIVGRRVEPWYEGLDRAPRRGKQGERMKRVLITGITGFAGSHLADHVLAEHPGVEVFGTYRWRSRRENIEHLEGRIRLLECDLGDVTAMRRALEAAAQPDAIFHLAAQSFVPTSWVAPAETLHVNVDRPDPPLRGDPRCSASTRSIQIACSSEEYGLVLQGRDADQRDESAAPALALCGLQGDARTFSPTSTSRATASGGPHPRLQPRGAAPRRGVRDVELRPADRRDRGGRAGAGDPGRQSRLGARFHRRARHGAGLLARRHPRRARRGLQHRIGQRHHDPRHARPPDRDVARRRCASSPIRRACAPRTSRCCSATARSSAPPPAGSRASRSSQTLADTARLLARAATPRARAIGADLSGTGRVRVLVTGANGFLGRHLVEALARPWRRVGGGLARARPRCRPTSRSIAVDVRDRAGLEATFDAVDPDVVVHLAALSHVGESWQRMDEYFAINVARLRERRRSGARAPRALRFERRGLRLRAGERAADLRGAAARAALALCADQGCRRAAGGSRPAPPWCACSTWSGPGQTAELRAAELRGAARRDRRRRVAPASCRSATSRRVATSCAVDDAVAGVPAC